MIVSTCIPLVSSCCMLAWLLRDHDFTLLLMCSSYFFSCSKSLLAICCIKNQPRLDLNDQRDGIFRITYLTPSSLFLSCFIPWVGRKIRFYQLSGFFLAFFFWFWYHFHTEEMPCWYHTFFGGFIDIRLADFVHVFTLFVLFPDHCLRSWWGLGHRAVRFEFGIHLV